MQRWQGVSRNSNEFIQKHHICPQIVVVFKLQRCTPLHASQNRRSISHRPLLSWLIALLCLQSQIVAISKCLCPHSARRYKQNSRQRTTI
ncbi:unnamed protein product [Trifolium pratense]|uniref:Uncharacterized protein n=1 Tax=Trifolium pratense TaxID=57577 RepID=A0ACB0J1D9_TRIPR|nr:unnamed protein product [Trifolium pratense]